MEDGGKKPSQKIVSEPRNGMREGVWVETFRDWKAPELHVKKPEASSCEDSGLQQT